MSHVRSGGMLLLLALMITLMLTTSALAAPPSGEPDFGPNMLIFDTSMTTAEIQTAADAIYAQQVDDEMGPNRYALLFKPGVYGTAETPLIIKVGYLLRWPGWARSRPMS